MGVPGKRLCQHRPELPIVRTEIVKSPPAAVKRLNPVRTARVVSASQVIPAAKAWQSLPATTTPTNSAQSEKPAHPVFQRPHRHAAHRRSPRTAAPVAKRHQPCRTATSQPTSADHSPRFPARILLPLLPPSNSHGSPLFTWTGTSAWLLSPPLSTD